jgi:hypothetical protein
MAVGSYRRKRKELSPRGRGILFLKEETEDNGDGGQRVIAEGNEEIGYDGVALFLLFSSSFPLCEMALAW